MATDYISPWGGRPTSGKSAWGYSAVPDYVKQHFAGYMDAGTNINAGFRDPNNSNLLWQALNTLPGGEGGEPGNPYGGYRVYQPSADGGFNWEPGSEGTNYDVFKEDGSYVGTEGFGKPTASNWVLALPLAAGAAALAAGAGGAAAGAGEAAGGAGAAGTGAVSSPVIGGGAGAVTATELLPAAAGGGLATGAGAAGLGAGAGGAAGTGAVSSPVIGGGAGAVTSTPLLPASAGGGLATGGGAGLLEALKTGVGKMAGTGGFDWTSLIGPATQLIGGKMGADAAKDASAAQLQAAREAMALNEPFRQGGMAGMNRLLDVLGLSGNTGAEGYGSAARDFSMADYQADPGYQFRQSEGEKAIQRAASAAGRSDSGRAYKDLMRFNQDAASQEYGRAFDRFQVNRSARLNPLQSLMGAGQTAANTIGGYASQAGDARAAGTMGRANALSDALTQGYSMYQGQQNRDYENSLADRMLRARGV